MSAICAFYIVVTMRRDEERQSPGDFGRPRPEGWP